MEITPKMLHGACSPQVNKTEGGGEQMGDKQDDKLGGGGEEGISSGSTKFGEMEEVGWCNQHHNNSCQIYIFSLGASFCANNTYAIRC